MTDPNHLMTLTLSKANGEVLGTWTIGRKPEFDIEDLSASPGYDFYVEGYTDSKTFGQEVWLTEIVRMCDIGIV